MGFSCSKVKEDSDSVKIENDQITHLIEILTKVDFQIDKYVAHHIEIALKTFLKNAKNSSELVPLKRAIELLHQRTTQESISNIPEETGPKIELQNYVQEKRKELSGEKILNYQDEIEKLAVKAKVYEEQYREDQKFTEELALFFLELFLKATSPSTQKDENLVAKTRIEEEAPQRLAKIENNIKGAKTVINNKNKTEQEQTDSGAKQVQNKNSQKTETVILDLNHHFQNNKTSTADRHSVEYIKEIFRKAQSYEESVKNYIGTNYSIEFFVLDENLMQLQENLDKVKSKNEEFLNEKIKTINYIKGLQKELDSRATPDEAQVAESSKLQESTLEAPEGAKTLKPTDESERKTTELECAEKADQVLKSSQKTETVILDLNHHFQDNKTSTADRESVEYMKEILKKAQSYEEGVKNYSGTNYSLEFFILDENLMQLLENLDKVKSKNEEMLNEKVKIINYIRELQKQLDLNATPDETQKANVAATSRLQEDSGVDEQLEQKMTSPLEATALEAQKSEEQKPTSNKETTSTSLIEASDESERKTTEQECAPRADSSSQEQKTNVTVSFNGVNLLEATKEILQDKFVASSSLVDKNAPEPKANSPQEKTLKKIEEVEVEATTTDETNQQQRPEVKKLQQMFEPKKSATIPRSVPTFKEDFRAKTARFSSFNQNEKQKKNLRNNETSVAHEDSVEYVEEKLKKAKSLEERVKKYPGTDNSREFFTIKESLMQLLEHLNRVKGKNQEVLNKKNNAIKYIKGLQQELVSAN